MASTHALSAAARKRRRSGATGRHPRLRERALLSLRGAPVVGQLLFVAIVVVALFFGVNAAYQVARKPTELFFPVSGSLDKTPAETWRLYEPTFRTHATAVITPQLLAALAQVEGAGNPVARTYWRWRPSWNPFAIYRPASSAAGMYQITDGTFHAAKSYCIHDHAVVERGAWYDVDSCWFNGLYTRVVPSHAVEMTSALLDRQVALTLGRRRIRTATLRQKQDLAAVIHLCGAGAGDAYARRGFQLTRLQRCGAHDVRSYLARVNAAKRGFGRLAGAG
jgi:hypothetical protein